MKHQIALLVIRYRLFLDANSSQVLRNLVRHVFLATMKYQSFFFDFGFLSLCLYTLGKCRLSFARIYWFLTGVANQPKVFFRIDYFFNFTKKIKLVEMQTKSFFDRLIFDFVKWRKLNCQQLITNCQRCHKATTKDFWWKRKKKLLPHPPHRLIGAP